MATPPPAAAAVPPGEDPLAQAMSMLDSLGAGDDAGGAAEERLGIGVVVGFRQQQLGFWRRRAPCWLCPNP